jgi:hypothetical protein
MASTTASQKTPNRLSKEKSPYLLQHQYNPVDWYDLLGLVCMLQLVSGDFKTEIAMIGTGSFHVVIHGFQ